MDGRNMGMRPIIAFFLLMMATWPLMAASEGAVYINAIEGNVEYIPAASQKAGRAKPQKPLAQGDTLTVANPGNAEIFVRDGSIIRITEGSRLKVLAIEQNAVQFFLESGKAYVKCSGLNGHPVFVSTPTAQLDGYDRSVFRADITPAGDTEVSVYSGQLYVAQPKGRMTIVAGTRLIMKQDGGTPVYTTNRPADAWDSWNRKKDGADPGTGMTNPQPGAAGNVNPVPQTVPPVAGYPPQPVVVDREYVYVASAPYGWYPYYYPWGYRPYPWRWYGYGPYYRGWYGPRPWYGPHRYGYRGRPWGPGHYRGRR